MQVTLYTKPDCPLCDELKQDLQALRGRFALEIAEYNIEENVETHERFRYLVPVLDVESGPVLYPPHTWQGLTTALAETSRMQASGKTIDGT